MTLWWIGDIVLLVVVVPVVIYLLNGVLTHPEWGVEMISFFQLHDWASESSEREEQFGILRQDGSAKPAYPIVQSAMAKYAG